MMYDDTSLSSFVEYLAGEFGITCEKLSTCQTAQNGVQAIIEVFGEEIIAEISEMNGEELGAIVKGAKGGEPNPHYTSIHHALVLCGETKENFPWFADGIDILRYFAKYAIVATLYDSIVMSV